MSCEIKTLAKIVDLERVCDLFGLNFTDDWLNSVYYSISPTLEIIAFGHGTKIVLLGQNWKVPEADSLNVFSTTWTGELENANDFITSVICLPVVGQSSHTQTSPEWTTIAIGLSSGNVLFYTDSGIQINNQQWHNEPVVSLKAYSGKKISEELHIAYQSCVCIVQGSHLFQVLKTMKSQFLKSVITKNDLSPCQETIPCRKWGYSGKNATINDTVVVGAQTSSGFDHLLTATLEGGFYAKYRSSPPQNSLVIAVGAKPYTGFHFAKEGFVQPVLADVARAVASKIKSALPSWLTGNQSQLTETPPPPTPAEPMVCRFGLCDVQRTAMEVYLAPGNKYAAVTDSLGRVILVDCARAIALRVWKGYREAHCSFIEVVEKNSKSNQKMDRRHALFLVIYAPRRSVLEIWPLQRGVKTAAFSASKNGQLIFNSYGLMGSSPGAKIKYTHPSCLFFDPSDNTLKEIHVPFHCALSDSNSKIAKDLHILRRIKLCLKCDGTQEQIIDEIDIMALNLQTNDIRQLCLDIMSKSNKITPNIFSAAINSIENQIKLETEECDVDNEMPIDDPPGEGLEILHEKSETEITPSIQRNQLLILCENYKKLIAFYNYVTDASREENCGSEIQTQSMSVSSTELNSIQKLLDLLCLEQQTTMSDGPKVTFEDKQPIGNPFILYISSFNAQNEDLILLREDKFENFPDVGAIIFRQFFERGKSLDKFIGDANQSGILCEDFMKLLLCYWLDQPFLYTKSEELIMDMTRFTGVLENICLLAGNKVEYEYGSISLWWQNIREMLLESSCALRGLLAAMMCRNQALKCGQKEYSNGESSSSNTEFEKFEELSQETCEWTLLISKLDDIAVLGAIVSLPLQVQTPFLPVLSYEIPDISLKSTLKGGKGIVSEIIGKWLTGTGLDPKNFLELEMQQTDESGSSNIERALKKYPLTSNELVGKDNEADIKMEVDPILSDPILNNLEMLREHFPFSLQSGVVLSQMTWEYMCYWSKNLSDLSLLNAGLECLKAIKPENWALKHGLACMVWNAHLKIPLEATRKLINKVGRLPKEKLCLQDIGMSDSLVPQFLDDCLDFLEHFRSSRDHKKINLQFEEILQDGPIPLTLLTLQQGYADDVLLDLHIELTMVLHFISFFNTKSVKPKNLFDGLSNQSFFCEINRKLPYTLPKSDLLLKNFRMEFLMRMITASMDLIREDFERIFLEDHLLWMDKIEKLGVIWTLDTAELRRHQIVELYNFGWDHYAEDLLNNTAKHQNIGNLLLVVAVRRLNRYIEKHPDAYSHVAAVGPQLTEYMESVSQADHDADLLDTHNLSIDRLIALTGQVFKCLSGKVTKELRVAGLLFDACHTIKELNT